ncbi:heparan-sulfate 6-O-sulfotransferase 2-like [Limulus polyphemus]|uniref:Heparan-sulfate 6-O-sulfotransferase n=1 Tax=Limulus polyphemus TaxID=6850 RepID=A0ABM1BGJ7_LIMPO|nr:heparan-sulfate 6-O-sulfotransferase 2-like [Limulus polyphemus]
MREKLIPVDVNSLDVTYSKKTYCSGKKKCRYLIFGVMFTSVFALSLFWYFCSSENCSVGVTSVKLHWPNMTSLKTKISNYRLGFSPEFAESESLIPSEIFDQNNSEKLNGIGFTMDKKKQVPQKRFEFNIKGSDVIVFLHIQNTGGNLFARHLVEDLAIESPCLCKKKRKMCKCFRPNKRSSWLFSRYTNGWKCGVHPDWTELTSCVDKVMDEEEGRPVKRRYFYITVLRDPVTRLLSEFWHVRKGLGWKASRHWCGGREVTTNDVPSCFTDKDLSKLTLSDFLSCPSNLGLNRQTRMLADLALVGCYNSSVLSKEEREIVMLESAKNNLHKMAFFGLSEFPKMSQYIFEATFDLYFLEKDEKQNSRNSGKDKSEKKALLHNLTNAQIEKIKELNKLDLELYQYAKKLLFYRFHFLKRTDPEFEDNFSLATRSKLSNVNWAEKEDQIESILK